MVYLRRDLFGLSKERPILDHHPKAQSEMRRFSYKMRRFLWNVALFIWNVVLLWKAALFVKSGTFHANLQDSWEDAWESAGFHVFNDFRCFSYEKCNAFHEKCRFSRKAPLFERPLARNCNPMFYLLDYVTRRSEKLRFGKKIGSKTNWWEISKYRLVCQIGNICNYQVLFGLIYQKNGYLQNLPKFGNLWVHNNLFHHVFFCDCRSENVQLVQRNPTNKKGLA